MRANTATPPISLRLDALHGSLSDPVLDTMNFLNEVTSRFPDAISFAPGRPHEGTFEIEQLTDHIRAYTDHLREERGRTENQIRTELFQYGRTNGQIHELIATLVRNDEGIEVVPESVVVTVGCQEGMLLVLRALFADPADQLLLSSPCYVGAVGAARLLDITTVPVPEGPSGLEPEQVRAAARLARAGGGRPRALYVVPDFANPSGASMSVAAREELLQVAREEDLLLIEDNPYGFFTESEYVRPTLKSLDTEQRVIYLGSFSKTAFPGARVGYVLADQAVTSEDGTRSLLSEQLSKIKSMTTVNTPALSQAVIAGILLRGGLSLRDANAPAIAFYRQNLRTLLRELDRHFPAPLREAWGISWNRPEGGFFLTLTLPFATDNAALEVSAREFGVLWTPMEFFYLGEGGSHQLRLSCSYLTAEGITAGVARLAAFIAHRRAIDLAA